MFLHLPLLCHQFFTIIRWQILMIFWPLPILNCRRLLWTIHLVKDFAENKSVTKSRVHCIEWSWGYLRGHKNVMPKLRWRFCQIFWPSQIVWTLQFTYLSFVYFLDLCIHNLCRNVIMLLHNNVRCCIDIVDCSIHLCKHLLLKWLFHSSFPFL